MYLSIISLKLEKCFFTCLWINITGALMCMLHFSAEQVCTQFEWFECITFDNIVMCLSCDHPVRGMYL